MVVVEGFEPPTKALSTLYSDQAELHHQTEHNVGIEPT
jgi:hypothetical protein